MKVWLRKTKEKYPVLTNRYVVASLVFLLWITVFDKNSLLNQHEHHQELMELKKSRRYYQKGIQQTKQDLEKLFGNQESLEQFAREKYWMHKADEEVFIILPEAS